MDKISVTFEETEDMLNKFVVQFNDEHSIELPTGADAEVGEPLCGIIKDAVYAGLRVGHYIGQEAIKDQMRMLMGIQMEGLGCV